MIFQIAKVNNIFQDTTWVEPNVTVFKDEVHIEFLQSGVTLKFDSLMEAMQVLNNIIRQIEGQVK